MRVLPSNATFQQNGGPEKCARIINCKHMCHKDELFAHASEQMSCLRTQRADDVWMGQRSLALLQMQQELRTPTYRTHTQTHHRGGCHNAGDRARTVVPMSYAARERHQVSAPQCRSSDETSKGKEGRKLPSREHRSQFHSATVCTETSGYQFPSAVFQHGW